MLYFASFCRPQTHWGQLFSIAPSLPPPSQLEEWGVELSAIDCSTFRDFVPLAADTPAAYWDELNSRKSSILYNLRFLHPGVTATLLFDRRSVFQSAALSAKAIAKYRPDCYGGYEAINPVMAHVAPGKKVNWIPVQHNLSYITNWNPLKVLSVDSKTYRAKLEMCIPTVPFRELEVAK